MILTVQRKCVGLCREDSKTSLDEMHVIAEDDLFKGLQSLGFNITRRVLAFHLAQSPIENPNKGWGEMNLGFNTNFVPSSPGPLHRPGCAWLWLVWQRDGTQGWTVCDSWTVCFETPCSNGRANNLTNHMFVIRAIYVPRDDRFPSHFHGIGIRIEDSVCVDETTSLVLSSNAAKEVLISCWATR